MHARRRIGISLLILLTLLLVLWAFSSRERLLLSQATRVAQEKDWSEYRWISPQEVLIIRNPPVDFGWDLSRYDLRTHSETELTALNRRLPDSLVMHGQWELSPDGRWCLWTDENSGICSARLDGSGYRKWPGDWHTEEIHWMGDSRHWLTLQGAWPEETFHQFLVRNVEAPTEKIVIPLSDMNPFVRVLGDNAIYVLAQDHLFVETGSPNITNCFTLTEFSMRPTVTPLRRFSIHPPSGWHMNEYQFSPRGDRIAWLFTYDQTQFHPSPLMTFLHRFLPFVHNDAPDDISLWVSALDGSGMHEIGRAPAKHSPTGQLEPDLLEWLPDGKRLSFRYNGSLWTVPALTP